MVRRCTGGRAVATMRELGLDRLTAEERLALADELYGSLPGDGPALTASQSTDLELRMAEYLADPSQGSSVDEVEARLIGKRP